MKNAIIFLLILVIILLTYFLISSRKIEAPVIENTNEPSNNQEQIIDMSSIENGIYTVDTSKSTIKWTGRKKILKNWVDTGNINIQSGNIIIENGSIASNELIIDMSSIKANGTGSGSGETQLENHLKSSDFFNVEEYPTSKLELKEIKTDESGKLNLISNLTIKGITNEVIIPASVELVENQYNAKGSVDIDRTLWDIKFGSEKFFQGLGDNIIEDQINIEFDVFLSKNDQLQ